MDERLDGLRRGHVWTHRHLLLREVAVPVLATTLLGDLEPRGRPLTRNRMVYRLGTLRVVSRVRDLVRRNLATPFDGTPPQAEVGVHEFDGPSFEPPRASPGNR